MTTRTGSTCATVPGIWFWEVFRLVASYRKQNYLWVNSPQKCVPFQFIGWLFAKLSFTFTTQIHIDDLYVTQWHFRIIVPDLSATKKCNMSYIWDSALRLVHGSFQIIIIREGGPDGTRKYTHVTKTVSKRMSSWEKIKLLDTINSKNNRRCHEKNRVMITIDLSRLQMPNHLVYSVI